MFLLVRSPASTQRFVDHGEERNDEVIVDVFDGLEDVDLDYLGKLPHRYVEVIVGANKNDIDKVAEPIVALEYIRWKNRQRKPAISNRQELSLGGILFVRQKR